MVGLPQLCTPSSEAESVFPGLHAQTHIYSMYMLIYIYRWPHGSAQTAAVGIQMNSTSGLILFPFLADRSEVHYWNIYIYIKKIIYTCKNIFFQ